MNAAAQLLVIRYNGRYNACEGARNVFTPISVVDKEQIKEAITQAFKVTLGKHLGCVLVKFDGKMYLCERDTVRPEKIYTRHEISYHPLQQHFTI